jgi:hypothetical protein
MSTQRNKTHVDDAFYHISQMVIQAERQTRRPRHKLCFLIAQNMRGLFEYMADDLWGMKVYSHPFLEEGFVQVAPGRFSWGDPAVDRLWTELKELHLRKA